MLRERYDKLWADERRKQQTIMEIMNAIREKPLSIAQLGRKLNINRSTLRYYLAELRADGSILTKRQENSPGRPTLIKINKKKFEAEFKKNLELAKQHWEEYRKSPYTKEIIRLLRSKGKATPEEIATLSEKFKETPNNPVVPKLLMTLNWLKIKNYVSQFYELTAEGKQFLKENTK